MPVNDSFKSKLLSMSTLGNWSRFGASKEKLKIEEGDITIIESSTGHAMKFSSIMNQPLCQPWSNALILKIMGRSHSLSFMLSKLSHKWWFIGQCQLTDLADGYFVVRFQMRDDLEYVLTREP
ncbi:hypothetical protein Dsin_008271 [Dipteronia sinensis]|uniref:DUF4283 domain-containing protein n=1 Tax=Dipteronia sinensis TaxID=43782 RepID=A0AAE0AN78_9ROSI|nr:hypothetical protein Dsin_008271 [Dipteronia sinensis]